MEDHRGLSQPDTPNVAPEDVCGTISVQVLEFKTDLLEAVEELHIHRDAEMRYEEQICKLVLEKQELEWQKESLQSQISRMSNENSESLAAIKKQFQAKIRRIEGEKGKKQLSAELKDKEISSLKEELKQLQLLKYSLEKKLAELEQKLQLQAQVKDSHLAHLGETERRFAAVSRQCAGVRQAHQKLEQNVEEAIRINKKLSSVNGKQESTIKSLNEDVEKLHKELLMLKVSSACRPGEEHLRNIQRNQELQQLQHKLLVEAEMNKKLRHEAVTERAEKEEVLRSLLHTQQLLQMQTEALIRAEQDLHNLQEEHQVLKSEHKLKLERVRETQKNFERLRDECDSLKLALDKQTLQLQRNTETDHVELKTVNETHSQHLCVSAELQKEDVQTPQFDLHQELKTEERSHSRTVNEINLVKVDSFHGDVSVEPEENVVTPHENREPMRCPVKRDPDESSDCQKPDGCKVSPLTEVSPTKGPEVLNVRREEVMMGQLSDLCAEIKTIICESETVDEKCFSNPAPGLTELSEPETLEQNLCISEPTELQTSESKETTEQTEYLQGFPQTEYQPTTERLSEDRPTNSQPQHTADPTHLTEDFMLDQPGPCEEPTHQEPQRSPVSMFPCSLASLDQHYHEPVPAVNDAVKVKDQVDVSPTSDFWKQTFSPHPIRNPSQDSSPDGFLKANNWSDVDHKHKTYQPSFTWDTFMKGQMTCGPLICGDGSVDQSMVIRDRKPRMNPPPSTLTVDMKTTDKLETPNKHLHQNSDSPDEWNETKQSCCETSVEKENAVITSYITTAAVPLGQTHTTVLPPKPSSLESSAPVSEGLEPHIQSDTKMVEFISSEGLMPPKIRKIE